MSEDVQGQAAEDSESAESSEATIAVHWREEGYYPPPPKFIGQANASDPAILDRFAEENFPECFREYADLLDWDEYWHTTLDTSNPPFWKWFVGGKLNASYNCVDRHLAKDRNKAALIWVPEPEDAPPVAAEDHADHRPGPGVPRAAPVGPRVLSITLFGAHPSPGAPNRVFWTMEDTARRR